MTQPNPKKHFRRVLSIDGGGIRGIIPALVIAHLEQKTGQPASELFDLIVGTSTGGMLALGLALPTDGDGNRAANRPLSDRQRLSFPSSSRHKPSLDDAPA